MGKSTDSSGSWLMTYADFITLVMIFFVMLYILTPGIEQHKFEAIVGAFQNSRGVLNHRSAIQEEGLISAEIERARSWEELQEYIDTQGLSDQVQVDLMSDGIRIILGEAVTFDTYSTELKPEGQQLLMEVGDKIGNYTAEDLDKIEIGGHTDNQPIKSNAAPYTTNWELGFARATTVLNYLIRNVPVSEKYFKASTYGEHRPRADNSSEEGRRKNRRVEIYVRYKQDSPQGAERTSGRKIETLKSKE